MASENIIIWRSISELRCTCALPLPKVFLCDRIHPCEHTPRKPSALTHAAPTYYWRHRKGARVAVHVSIRKLAGVEVVNFEPPVLIHHHLLGLYVVVHDGAARGLVKGL